MKVRIVVDEHWPIFSIAEGDIFNDEDLIDIPEDHLEYYKKVQEDYNHMQAKLKELFNDQDAASA